MKRSLLVFNLHLSCAPVLASLFVYLLLTNASFATVRFWTGGGANNNWATAANWVTNVVPGAADAGEDEVFGAGVR